MSTSDGKASMKARWSLQPVSYIYQSAPILFSDSMKGITPVIAVILLLLVTISMIAFAFVWFGRVSTTAMNAVENSSNQMYNTAGKIITIDNIESATSKVTVRNIGTLTIAGSELVVYKSNALVTCSFSSIAPGQSGMCQIAGGGSCAGLTIKVTAPGNFDQTTC